MQQLINSPFMKVEMFSFCIKCFWEVLIQLSIVIFLQISQKYLICLKMNIVSVKKDIKLWLQMNKYYTNRTEDIFLLDMQWKKW